MAQGRCELGVKAFALFALKVISGLHGAQDAFASRAERPPTILSFPREAALCFMILGTFNGRRL